ncbi:MAG: hypothetical protein QG597_4284 [Actinomycetota bacterium]|nr:hypothetical protein [Actinomycetota bacterium]
MGEGRTCRHERGHRSRDGGVDRRDGGPRTREGGPARRDVRRGTSGQRTAAGSSAVPRGRRGGGPALSGKGRETVGKLRPGFYMSYPETRKPPI